MKITQKKQELETFVQAILSGRIEVGDVIRQSELCEILGISRTPLRELLVLLEELELVEVKPRSGFKIIYPDIDFMRENMQFRVMIERHALEGFLEGLTDDWIATQIAVHEALLADLAAAEEPRALSASIVEQDQMFHRAIVASLENRAILKSHDYTQTKLRIARQVHRRIPPRKANMAAMRDHLRILAAMETRDLVQIRSALDAHLASSIHDTLMGYQARGGSHD